MRDSGRWSQLVSVMLCGAASLGWAWCPADRRPAGDQLAQQVALSRSIDHDRYPHEPAGFQVIAANEFTALPMQRGALAGEWREQKQHRFRLAPASERDEPDGIAFSWPAGLKSGIAPVRFDAWDHLAIGRATRYRKLYVSTTVRICGRDFENQKVGTKLWYVGYGNTKQYNDAFLMLEGNYKSSHVGQAFRVVMYISPADDREAPSHAMKQNLTRAPLVTVGDWHQIEVYLDVGTPDRADGELRVWVDGRLVTDRDRVKYLDSDYDFTQGFFRWQWTPVWGGVGGTRTREDQMEIRNVYLSGVPE